MSRWPAHNATRPAPGSLLHRWLEKPHPDSFECGVRVIAGAVPGEGDKWRYRRSAVDPLISGGVVRLNHGSKVHLELRVDPNQEGRDQSGTRLGFVVLDAVTVSTGAELEVSVPTGELARFGIEL